MFEIQLQFNQRNSEYDAHLNIVLSRLMLPIELLKSAPQFMIEERPAIHDSD